AGAKRSWLLCVSRRDQDTGFTGSELPGSITLRLDPLSGADAAALVAVATEDVPLSRHAVAALAERSGGNPLFLRELASVSGPARTGGSPTGGAARSMLGSERLSSGPPGGAPSATRSCCRSISSQPETTSDPGGTHAWRAIELARSSPTSRRPTSSVGQWSRR